MHGSNPFNGSSPTKPGNWQPQASAGGSRSTTPMAGVGRAGFLRDPSGLLMSIIRTLAASGDDHQRDLEKERLEEAFAESDEKLDSLVSDNYEELAITIKQFSKIGERISASRSRIKKVRDNLQQCKSLLYCRQDELRKLWVEGVEHKKVLFLLDQIERVKEAPQLIESYMKRKLYLRAAELVIQTIQALQDDLIGVEALGDIRNELFSKKIGMHEVFINELHRQIYVNSVEQADKKTVTSVKPVELHVDTRKSTSSSVAEEDGHIGTFDSRLLALEDLKTNPDDDPKKLITVLVESLARLNRVPEMIEATKTRIDRHINMVVTNSTVEVTDLAFHGESGHIKSAADGSNRLLQLLQLLFGKFRRIADSHAHVLCELAKIDLRRKIDVQPYTMETVWAKIQQVLQILLNEYLDADNAAQAQPLGFTSTESSLSSHFARKRMPQTHIAKLFRFDRSSHAISMNNYLREQRAQQRHSATFDSPSSPLLEHALSTQKVCQPNARNITIVFAPLKQFIGEIESALGIRDRRCALHEYITDYIQDVFIRQIQYELKKEFDAAMKVAEPLKINADPLVCQELGADRQLLQGAVVADKCLWYLYDLTRSLDSYHDHFLSMACSLTQEYKEIAIQAYRGIVQPEAEDRRLASATWVADRELNDVVRGLDNWRRTFGQLPPDKLVDRALQTEAQFFMHRMQQTQPESLRANLLIADFDDWRAIASLHESLEWMATRLREFIAKIESCAPADTLATMTRLADDYQNLCEVCLLSLHVELRLRCFYHFAAVFNTSNFDIRGLDSLEQDPPVAALVRDLKLAQEHLGAVLEPAKFAYVFEGVGHQVAAVAVGGARHVKRISAPGVKKMCRNLFVVQQALTAITRTREPQLDLARQFYELAYMSPDDLQPHVVEHGARFAEDEYVEALRLIHRSKPGAGPQPQQNARAQRLRAIVNEQLLKKEQQEQEDALCDVDV